MRKLFLIDPVKLHKSVDIVAENRQFENPLELFYTKNDVSIADPYLDESGRFEVDPIECYGQLYVDWVNSI
jgi:hypothetical protein